MIDLDALINIEIEQALLGAILVNNEALACVPFLEAAHFSEPLHREIFAAAADLIGRGRIADPKTLRSALPAAKIGDLTLPQYLARLAAEATTVLNAGDYGRSIVELAFRRAGVCLGEDLIEAAANGPDLSAAIAETVAALKALPIDNRQRHTLRRTMFGEIDREPRKDWLVHGLLGAGEFSSFFGAPGCGKSTIVGDIAAHVAAGRSWFGRSVARGAALYIAAERAAVVKRRFAAFRQHHGVEDLPLAVLAGMIDLRTTGDVATEIIDHAKELEQDTGLKVALVVLDTYSRALAGGDENSPKDSGAVIVNLTRIMEGTGAHVSVLHHMPVDGARRLRGHGNLLGALDTGILVDKAGGARMATVEKANDGAEGVTIGFDLQSVTLSVDPDSHEATTASVVIALDGPIVRTAPAKRLNDRQKLGLDVLRDLCVEGAALPPMFDLPSDIRAVPINAWRDELVTRGVIDRDAANPRADFTRLRDQLATRHLIGIRDPHVWAV